MCTRTERFVKLALFGIMARNSNFEVFNNLSYITTAGFELIEATSSAIKEWTRSEKTTKLW